MGFVIIDLVIILILLISIGIGFFKNPIFAGINLVLFIGFTFLFNFVLVSVLPAIVASFNLEEVFLSLIESLKSANEQLKSLNYGFSLLPEYMMDINFYNGLSDAAISVVSFFVSTLLALLVSYGLTWLIYGLMKKFFPKFKDLCNKIKEKKALRFPLGIASSLIFSIIFVSVSFTPLNQLANGVEKPLNNLSSIEINDTFKDELDKAYEIKDQVDRISARLDAMEVEVNELNGYFQEYMVDVDEFAEGYRLLANRVYDYGQDIGKLLEKNLSSTDRAVLNDASNGINQVKAYYPQIDATFGEVQATMEGYEKQIQDGIEQLNNVQNMIDENLKVFNDAESTINTATETIEMVKEYSKQAEDILNLSVDSSWFDWLLNLNIYPYFDFTYNDENHNLIGEFENLDSSLSEFVDTNFAIIEKLLKDNIGDVESQIAEGEAQLSEYEQMLVDIKEEIDGVKDQVDGRVEDAYVLLDEANILLDQAGLIIDGLKAKYGVM